MGGCRAVLSSPAVALFCGEVIKKGGGTIIKKLAQIEEDLRCWTVGEKLTQDARGLLALIADIRSTIEAVRAGRVGPEVLTNWIHAPLIDNPIGLEAEIELLARKIGSQLAMTKIRG